MTMNSLPVSNRVGTDFSFSAAEDLREAPEFLEEAFPLSLYTQRYRCETSDSIPLHWHEELQITCMLEGELEYCVNGRSFLLTEGHLLILNLHQLHSSRAAQRDARTLCINFRPELFHPFLVERTLGPLLENPSFSCVLLTPEAEMLAQMRSMADCSCETLDYFSVFCLLTQLCQATVRSLQSSGEKTDSRELALFHAMLDFVHQHYAEPLTVPQIAASALTNKSRCGALFRKYAGLSPVQYLNDYRLHAAKNLLLHTERSVSEISADAGYNQVSYFVAQFRGRYGLPPLKYRNRYGKGGLTSADTSIKNF